MALSVLQASLATIRRGVRSSKQPAVSIQTV
jgi:hypothetical protein